MTYVGPIVDTINVGRDNLLRYVLYANGDVLDDLSAVTRVVVSMGGYTFDSDVVGSSVIWWTDTQTHQGATVDVLTLKLGGQSIDAGTYTDVEIIVYDATYTNGLVVENPVKWVAR